jgi:thiol:disulfide interchange protein DsbD
MILSGSPLDYIKVFIGGVGVSLTPCVLPLVPVVIGYIGITAATKKFKGFLMSLVYVTGISFTYALLGLFASLTGRLFGTVSAHPVTNFIVGSVIILFGISMLDFFSLPLPRFFRLPAFESKGYFSTFVLGASSGFIIGPCTAPALGAILMYLATKENVLYAVTLLVSFAYGVGFLLILAGTFSSVLVNLRALHKWSESIKKAGAFILIGIGIYFVYLAIRRM